MRKIEQFTGKYKLSKTLRFSLIPVGETEKYIRVREYIEEDEKRAKDYIRLKEIIDGYHIQLIDKVLRSVRLPELEEYRELYENTTRNDSEEKRKRDMEAQYLAFLSGDQGGVFYADSDYGKLFGKELLTELLPPTLKTDEDKGIVAGFSSFYTYLYGFNDNRQNVYSKEAIPTAVGNRCIHENLPRFLDNLRSFERVKCGLGKQALDDLRSQLDAKGIDLDALFCLDGFNAVLAQSGIDRYNTAVGGYTEKSGEKSVKGLNQLINEHNQICAKGDRLPRLKPLYKQILSERISYSWIPEEFKTDGEVYTAVRKCMEGEGEAKGLLTVRRDLGRLFSDLSNYDLAGIYLDQVGIRAYSNGACGSWSDIQDAWFTRYDAENGKKRRANYEEIREKAWKKETCLSLKEIGVLADKLSAAQERVISAPEEYWRDKTLTALDVVLEKYGVAEKLLKTPPETGLRTKDAAVIGPVKQLLDSVKDLENLLRPFAGTEKEGQGDAGFYGEFLPLWDELRNFDRLYDRVRNYVTKKPYSQEKFKLNFHCSSFLSGWSQNWASHDCILIERKGQYYLGVLDQGISKESQDQLLSNGDAMYLEYMYQKVDSKNFPRLFIRSKGDRFAPSVRDYGLPVQEILEVYDQKKYKAEYKRKDPVEYLKAVHQLINYYKLGLSRHPSYVVFPMSWKKTEQYESMEEFYTDVQECCYQIKKRDLNWQYLLDLVADGKLYLFQIYNKDFSPYSKGKPNLHTLYFRMLFDERNLADTVFKLSGGAELFYRKASLPAHVTHPAGKSVANKGPLRAANKAESVFPYDLIKDKRYTRPQFSLHLSIEMNTQAPSKPQGLDDAVREVLASDPETKIIGIDRGERNLLYICVIDEKGHVLEQRSLNTLEKDGSFPVDYQAKLAGREKENDEARKNWTTIQGIRELKEGYLSQVVHELCRLVEKYDAVIALEDLNPGFKNSRKKVERQVYQKFENALIDKLSFLADKSTEPDAPGGLLHAYQLAKRPDRSSDRRRQNGFILYVDPGFTSKIDPVTGFADLLYPRYTSVPAALELIEKLDAVRYVPEDRLFAVDVDYEKFEGTASSLRKKWTLWSYGERIRTYRDRKTGQWNWEEIDLSDSFRRFFDCCGIDITGDIRKQLLEHQDKETLEGFIYLLRLTLQMRNSVPNGQEDDLISPVRDENGNFFDTKTLPKGNGLPENADANGAYNIARKALLMIREMREDPKHQFQTVKREDWLEYVQSHE